MKIHRASRYLSVAAAAMLVPACVFGGASTEDGEVTGLEDGHGHAPGECKIEGSDLGVVGASVYCEGVTYTFAEWYEKDGEPNEYIGFRLENDAEEFIVKAGGERYVGSGSEWLHPNGTGGPEVNAVSHVDFCDEDGHGDEGGECNDPDGCEGGSGDDGAGDGDGDGSGDCNDPDGCEGGDGSGGDGSGDGSGDGDCNDPDGCDGADDIQID